MRAHQKDIIDAAWASAQPLIGQDRKQHSFNGRACFNAIAVRVVNGCSRRAAAMLCAAAGSATTLRRRYRPWLRVGVFDWLATDAIESNDRVGG